MQGDTNNVKIYIFKSQKTGNHNCLNELFLLVEGVKNICCYIIVIFKAYLSIEKEFELFSLLRAKPSLAKGIMKFYPPSTDLIKFSSRNLLKD